MKLIVSVIALTFIFAPCHGIQAEKDLILTGPQKALLDKFKKRMEPFLPHDYMKTDIYLVRWLRVKNFNLDDAELALLDTLNWREKLKMDQVLEEDWGDYNQRYRFWRHGVDREGQPICYLGLGSWDLRKAVVSGEREKLNRYLAFAVETMVTKVRKLQEEGKNVTRQNLFVDLNGFNLVQQGCLSCVSFYIELVSIYENRYPLTTDKIVLVNTPAAFEVVLTAIRPLMSKPTRDSLEIYGTNKNQWLPIIAEYAEESQLPPELGGTDYTKYDET